jgi:hypothetical protein
MNLLWIPNPQQVEGDPDMEPSLKLSQVTSNKFFDYRYSNIIWLQQNLKKFNGNIYVCMYRMYSNELVRFRFLV